MKKLITVLALCLLAGCSSKETIEVDYVHANHNDVAEKVFYLKCGKTNYALPKEFKDKEPTLEDAVKIIAAKK